MIPTDPAALEIYKSILVNSGPLVLKSLHDKLKGQRVKRVEELVKELDRRIARAEAKLDPELFDALLNKAMVASMSDVREFKTALFVAILAGVYSENTDAVPAALFVSLIEKFEPYHIAVLRDMLATEGTDRGRDASQPPAFGFQYIVELVSKATGFDGALSTDLATSVLSDLMYAGLIHTRMSAAKAGVMLTGINPVGLLRIQVFTLSPLGIQFVSYLIDSGLNSSTTNSGSSSTRANDND